MYYLRTVCDLRYRSQPARCRTIVTRRGVPLCQGAKPTEPVAQFALKLLERGPARRLPATGPDRIAPGGGGGLGDTLQSARLAYVGTARVTRTSVREPTGVRTHITSSRRPPPTEYVLTSEPMSLAHILSMQRPRESSHNTSYDCNFSDSAVWGRNETTSSAVTPNENTSVPNVTGCPMLISGAMYPGVPTFDTVAPWPMTFCDRLGTVPLSG